MGIKERFGAALELPDELMSDTAKLTVTGVREISIEKYKGIIEYTNQEIRIGCKGYQVSITGTDLELKVATGEVVFIEGQIRKIEWVY